MTSARDLGGECDRHAALVELDLLHGESIPDLDRLVALASEICGAKIAAFTVHDEQRAYQISSSIGARETMPKEECLCSVALARGRTVAVPDVRIDRRTAEARHAVSEPFVRSFVGTPLGADPSTPIGVLTVGHTEPGRFGPREIERLELVAELVGAFLAGRRDAIRARHAAARTEDERTGRLAAAEQLGARADQLAEALTQAERANRARTDFMGVMSHELRTPMNAVMSAALLLSQSKLDPVQRRTLGVLEDAGRQMLALLNDLLDLSGLNTGKLRIEREPVSLVRLIEDAAVIWADRIKAKGLSLSVMIDPALTAPRSVDPARVLQILGNLMSNAIKFTTTGGIAIQAWPEGRKAGARRIAIEVEDSGPGVPPDAVERIFAPFEQADVSTRRRHGGLGLGLHVARRLALAMGGDVQLETRPEEGARFTVFIEAPQCDALSPAPPAPSPANDQTEPHPREILCIDDNPRNLYVLGAMLRAAGHRTTEVSSGAEALGQLAMRKFDVILLDMVMPEMDGLDMLAKLRAMGGVNFETPVIACTANLLPDQVEAYRKAGTVGVLAKPIDIRAMLQAVASGAA